VAFHKTWTVQNIGRHDLLHTRARRISQLVVVYVGWSRACLHALLSSRLLIIQPISREL
jgi:hypothetical protein